MKVILVTNDNKIDYVTLIANNVSRKNHLSVVETSDGRKIMSGGIIIEDTEDTRKVINSIEKSRLYKVLVKFRLEPFVKHYHE